MIEPMEPSQVGVRLVRYASCTVLRLQFLDCNKPCFICLQVPVAVFSLIFPQCEAKLTDIQPDWAVADLDHCNQLQPSTITVMKSEPALSLPFYTL